MAGSRAKAPSSDAAVARVKRVLAIPFSGGTTVVVRSSDFKNAGNIEHDSVTWDYRIDDFTVEVGKEINSEAAEFLVSSYPGSFKFVEG